MGLDAVATTVEAVLPHEWELPHPYSDRIWDDGREQLYPQMAKGDGCQTQGIRGTKFASGIRQYARLVPGFPIRADQGADE